MNLVSEMDKPTLLVVDDHEHILKQITWALRDDFDVHTAGSKQQALEALARVRPALMTVDLALSAVRSQEGFDVLREGLALDPALKAIIMDQSKPMEERFRAQLKLAALPRNSARIRIRNRCEVTGRPRAFYRKLKVSRIALRDLGNNGQIPGLVKSSW